MINQNRNNVRLPGDLGFNPNFVSELFALDNGTMSANNFFSKNLSVYSTVFNFTRKNGININDLDNSQISAIIISLYKLRNC
jgi:hypothetical protein